MHRSPKKWSMREGVGEIGESASESFRVPRELLGGELEGRILTREFVESGEMSKIPETGGEFDEIWLSAIERVENGKNDVGQSILESDFSEKIVSCDLDGKRQPGRRHTRRIESRIFEKRLSLEFDPVC